MIFTEEHARQILASPPTKWQTRRAVRLGDYAIIQGLAGVGDLRPHWGPTREDPMIVEVRDVHGRLKWQVGKDYAIQPGRGKKAIGRTPPIKAIRRERLQEISSKDCLAEGVIGRIHSNFTIRGFWNNIDPAPFQTAQGAFAGVWRHIYRKPYRWEDNPEVWVLHIEKEIT